MLLCHDGLDSSRLPSQLHAGSRALLMMKVVQPRNMFPHRSVVALLYGFLQAMSYKVAATTIVAAFPSS
jgi:hypothetical protein